MVLAFARRLARGEARSNLLWHAVRRSAIIFALGLFLNGFPYFDLGTLRIPGVLQRIAVCYLAASVLVLYTGLRGQLAALGGLMAAYWVLMTLVPVPGYGAGVLEKNGNFAQWVDRALLSGHMWSQTKTWDPEGIVSTLPAIGTVLFGVLAGYILLSEARPAGKAGTLLVLGAGLAGAGQVLDVLLPINKNLWTVSFAVFMAGMATVVFAASFWIIDVKGRRGWSRPFVIYGMNAIAVYVLAGMLGDLLAVIRVGGKPLKEWIYTGVLARLAGPYNASLLFAAAMVLVLFLVAWGMYRRRWFVKI
jgi:predicted acyltransferase